MVRRITRDRGNSTDRRRPSATLGLTLTAVLGAIVVMGLATAGCGSTDVTSTAVTGTTGDTVQTTTSTTGETPTTAGGTITTALPGPATTIGLPTTIVPSGTTTTEALSSAETLLPNGHIRAMGFIDKVWESGGVRRISIDYAEMLSGEEARIAAVEAGEIGPGEDLPNDYFIRNVNAQKREFTVSATAPIATATFGGGMDEPVSWVEFKSFWDPSPPAGGQHLRDMPWWIERDGGKVVSIAEQYLP